ncbi:uncharacterized protein G2W53_039410 [Senna tora]|uniref:Uncharacterized protein n=1 Tax=Senna tora TaxID=362788 RepID=A0A834SNJ8_9FABA|nr:uncharacterized protein G2W53_039410 [Senna tora]
MSDERFYPFNFEDLEDLPSSPLNLDRVTEDQSKRKGVRQSSSPSHDRAAGDRVRKEGGRKGCLGKKMRGGLSSTVVVKTFFRLLPVVLRRQRNNGRYLRLFPSLLGVGEGYFFCVFGVNTLFFCEGCSLRCYTPGSARSSSSPRLDNELRFYC